MLQGMFDEKAFLVFLANLCPHIQEQVGAHVHGYLLAAITMAERLDLFCASARQGTRTSGGSEHQYKGAKGESANKKGGAHSAKEKKESMSEVLFIK